MGVTVAANPPDVNAWRRQPVNTEFQDVRVIGGFGVIHDHAEPAAFVSEVSGMQGGGRVVEMQGVLGGDYDYVRQFSRSEEILHIAKGADASRRAKPGNRSRADLHRINGGGDLIAPA